jgi:hypothetical protein
MAGNEEHESISAAGSEKKNRMKEEQNKNSNEQNGCKTQPGNDSL